MISGYKIKCFVPSGRKHTLEVLFRYFQKNRSVIDEVQIWQNTPMAEDVEYFYEVERADSMFKVYTLPEEYTFFYMLDKGRGEQEVKWGKETRKLRVNRPGDNDYGPVQWNTGRFFEYTTDPNAIYFRFDDDIVFLEDDYFEKMVKYRLEHPEYFLIFGNIWNNAIISYIHQQEGRIGKDFGVVEEPYCMDTVGWHSDKFAEYIHNILLKEPDGDYSFTGEADGQGVLDWTGFGYELSNGHRFSISNFCFFGRDFAQFEGKFTDLDEEKFLTEVFPIANDVKNIISPVLCSHLTFSPGQKAYILNETDILQRYNKLSKKKLSDSYYNFLNTHK